MRKISILFFSVMFLFSLSAQAQDASPIYKIIIKGGHVIDAKNNIDELMDVAIQDGKIAKVAKNIDAALGEQIVDAKGMYVTPGLIDLHTHVFWGTELDHYLSNGLVVVPQAGFGLYLGVTTRVKEVGWG